MNGLEEESFHDCDLPYYSASAGRGVVGPPVQLGQLSVACQLQRAERILLLSLSPLFEFHAKRGEEESEEVKCEREVQGDSFHWLV